MYWAPYITVYIKNGFAPMQTACRSPPSFLPSPFGLPFQPNPIAVLSQRCVPLHPQPSQAIWLLIPQSRMWKFCLVAACAQDWTQKAKQPVFATFNQAEQGRVACRYDCLFAVWVAVQSRVIREHLKVERATHQSLLNIMKWISKPTGCSDWGCE